MNYNIAKYINNIQNINCILCFNLTYCKLRNVQQVSSFTIIVLIVVYLLHYYNDVISGFDVWTYFYFHIHYFTFPFLKGEWSHNGFNSTCWNTRPLSLLVKWISEAAFPWACGGYSNNYHYNNCSFLII